MIQKWHQWVKNPAKMAQWRKTWEEPHMKEGLIALQSKIIDDAKRLRAYDRCPEPMIPRMNEAGKIEIAITLEDYINYLSEPPVEKKPTPSTQSDDPVHWGDFKPDATKFVDFNQPPQK
jgi:hypothetical protein